MYKTLPTTPGVYFFKNKAGQIIYVGKARNLRDRVKSYFVTPKGTLLPKTAALVEEIASIEHIQTESEVDAFLLEAVQIKKLQPYYNIAGKDNSNYPSIEISLNDPIPLVKLVHQQNHPKHKYFGPYPPGSNVGTLLRYLRRVFPYAISNHKTNRSCLYAHLGLCPCQNWDNYPSDLKNLMAFLSGKRKTVQRDLKKQMLEFSKNSQFEQAAVIKNKLDQIEYITSGRYRPWEYEQNPNLVFDNRLNEIEELKKVLGLKTLEKIEGYDISNTSGQLSTGAMVTFVGGVPEKKLYRRYKIKIDGKPDDFAMMAEMLSRRIKSDNPLPDLMVVDGGKGQISAVAPLIKIPLIGLAKKQETIILKNGKEINMPTNSSALQLLQRIRDEAHRFSRRYHFLLRSKKLVE